MQTEALAAIIVLISTGITIHAAGLDIRQFVNQFEPLWTFKTTNRGHIKCEVDQLVSIRPLSITFKRSVFIRGSRCDFRILGVFDRRHKERMSLFYNDTFRRVESLLYVAVGHSCAVFKVESLREWHHFYYDLRVNNSSVQTKPLQACRTYFKEVKGREPSFHVYNPRCQGLLRQEK
uniref:Lipocalin n=1 Tax=Rhipicephalus zambeziensis TaxID=60191 RepID=A0A224YDR4_9ACAR